MAATVWEYFEQRRRECEKLGLPVEADGFWEKEGSNGTRGRIFMVHRLTDNAVLAVSEFVECRGSHIERLEYGYYLIINGQDYRSWDRDRLHGYHTHGLGHQRYPGERITFKRVVEECWEIITTEEWLEDAVPEGPDELEGESGE